MDTLNDYFKTGVYETIIASYTVFITGHALNQ
jgi:hypothetical protein